MLNWIELHPLATTIVGGLFVAFIIFLAKKIFGNEGSSKNQNIKDSIIGRDVQQAETIFNNSYFQKSAEPESKECKIKLAPFIDNIPAVLNGGQFQGEYACFQIRFGSETNLELIDAVLLYKTSIIKCKSRDSRLEEGKNWNSFMFPASSLPFIPEEVFFIKIRVSDHVANCCELSHELQMKQFYPTINPGKNFGRWEIATKGIFKIKCCDNKTFDEEN